MKQFFRKVFFCDAPEKGAFFALTFLLLFPVFFFAFAFEVLAPAIFKGTATGAQVMNIVWGTIGVALLIVLYLFGNFVVRCRGKKNHPWKKIGITAGIVLLLMIGCWGNVRTLPRWVPFGVPGLLVVCLICYLLYPRVRVRDWFYVLPPLALGMLGIGFSFRQDQKVLGDFIAMQLYADAVREVEKSLPYAFVGIVVLLLGYFLAARVLARVGGMPMRKIFGKAALALWGLAFLVYLLGICGGIYARHENRKARNDFEAYWQTPLDMEYLNEQYAKGKTVDQQFWNELKQSEPDFSALNDLCKDINLIIGFANGILPPEMHAKWKEAFLNSPERLKCEQMLDGAVPFPERISRVSGNNNTSLNTFSLRRSLMRWETWSIRFALEDKDFERAKQALDRMDRISESFLEDYTEISALVMLACEAIRANGLSLMLSSGLADEAWLKEQQAKLLEKEERFPQLQRRVIYGSAIIMICGTSEVVEASFQKLSFWLQPYAWWWAQKEVTALTRAYLIENFADFPSRPSPYCFVSMLSPGLQVIGKKNFPQLLATYRLSRGLLEAELANLRTGAYPECLENLPADPFSGESLKYGKRRHTLHEMRYELEDERDHEEETIWNMLQEVDEEEEQSAQRYVFHDTSRQVDAIRVWSVGPNGIDEDGECAYPGIAPDDLSLIINLE